MADRYWVGGTGTWDNSSTDHWSTSSGGSNGASVPGSSDNVIFDSSSGAGTVTISYSGLIDIGSLDIQSGSTLAFSTPSAEQMEISGNILIRSSSVSLQNIQCIISTGYTDQIDIQYEFFDEIRFGDAVASFSTFSGTITPSSTYINSGNTDIQFADFSTLNFDNDTIIFSGITFDVVGVGTPSGTRRVTFANNCIVTGDVLYFPATSASGRGNFTVTVNDSTISGDEILNSGSIDVQSNCTFQPVSAFYSPTANNLIVDGISSHLRLMSGGTTVNDSIVLKGASATDRLLVSTVFPAMTQSIWQSSAGIIESDGSGMLTVDTANSTFEDIDFWGRYDGDSTGSATLTGTNIGVAQKSQYVTGETPRTLYYLGGSWDSSASWSLSSGGTSGENPPLPQDTAIVESNTALSFTKERMLPDISSGLGNSVTVNSTASVYFNGLTNDTYIIANSSIPYFFLYRKKGKIDVDDGATIIFSGYETTTHYDTTIVTNIKDNVGGTAPQIYIQKFGSGTISFNSSPGALTNQATNVYLTSDIYANLTDLKFYGNSAYTLEVVDYYDSSFTTSTIVSSLTGTITSATSSDVNAKFEVSGSPMLSSMSLDIQQNDVVISGSPTFNSVTRSSNSDEATITISGTLSTSSWDAEGLSRAVPLNIEGNVTYTGIGTLELSNLSVENSTASPSDTWYAIDSEDVGGNSGWIFTTTGNGLFWSNF